VNIPTSGLLNKRVLKINVGFLLSVGPGNSKDVTLDITDPVRISHDLVASSVIGGLRLTRTKEGILVQTPALVVTVDRECARCLDPFDYAIPVEVEELYAYPHPISETEFFVAKDGQLDLSPLLRAEVFIALSHREYCRPDCLGLCIYCGVNHNYETCDCASQQIDPRMAKLRELLDTGEK